MRTAAFSIVVSVAAHAAIVWLTQRPVRAPAPRRHTVHVAVREVQKRPPLPAPKPPPPPPRRVARLAPKRIPSSVPPPPEPKTPPPPRGYSVDTKSTVAESSVAVAAKAGGGNPFADPNAGGPPGDRAVRPPPPPPPAPLSPAAWLTEPADRSPPYPSAALRNEIQGQVLLKVCIAPDGNVESVQLLRGLGFGCDEAAVAWAQHHWHFRPATRGGVAVRSCLMQPLRFQMQR
jgi:protein TonB